MSQKLFSEEQTTIHDPSTVQFSETRRQTMEKVLKDRIKVRRTHNKELREHGVTVDTPGGWGR